MKPSANRETLSILVLGAVVSIVLLLILFLKLDAESSASTEGYFILFGMKLNPVRFIREDIHNILWACTIAGSLLILTDLFFKSPQAKRWIFIGLLAVASISSLFAFYQYGLIRREVFDAGDTYHYYLGPKYFTELGYTDHYICTLIALEEMDMEMPPFVRDLRQNNYVKSATYLNGETRAYVHDRFTPDRWESFKKDIRTYRDWHNTEGWLRRMTDHGYNGTPVWNFFASAIANFVPVNHRNMSLLSLLNLLMVYVAFAFVIRAFGWRMGLLFVILFCINYPDRYLLGGAFLRYFWISSLAIGISLMKMNRYGMSGIFIGLAALLRIFPVFFLGAIAIKYVANLLKKEPDPPDIRRNHRRFLNAASLAMLVFVLLSLTSGRGVGNWQGFKEQMSVNSGRLATGRIGFLYNFLYPKEVSINDKQLDYEPRVERFEKPAFLFFSLKNLHNLLIVLIVVGLVQLSGKMDDVSFTALLGFALFFLFFSTVRYYYAGLACLPLMWHLRIGKPDGKIFTLLLFLIMAVAYFLTERAMYSFIYNTWLSGMFAVYLVAALGYLSWISLEDVPIRSMDKKA